ncbi:U1 small nuclear ribonucleoprotein A [Monoraphidium neglectum]|uniref:U1 small nuclear ribonucleoprotein A n=1 Tax=Monoraphidium neglectum TaxID=145388 RepID=A0A0D2N0T0_9CHLO|nr:U1 small nuclear ribonucleoprotein A [Monoraphidium neglectum]KIY99925.1 U1 small nuclear ribonucleoprotein A [Monoraphidium neglectum]|eukprot:XP_013898945.1 U1 small nuclear ribonucleoprotein A [Monoraphidium neglectum]
MFSQFGKIVDVVALKTYRLRGQAWVVFADVAAATNALRQMQGFPFFEKPIRIEYARGKSDAIAKLEGSYRPDKDRSKKNAVARETLKSKKAPGGAPGPAAAPGARPAAADGAAPPNKILFVQNLPEATTDAMLGMLFQQFPGFREVRLVDARPGIAFVEFENELQSGVALSGLQGFKVTPTNAMAITFAKG